MQIEGIEQSYVAKATEALPKIRNIGGSKQSSKYRPKGQSYKQSQNVQITKDSQGSNKNRNSTNDTSILLTYRRFDNKDCYITGAKTKRDWLIHGHVALDKCNVSLGQQVNNCWPLRPAAYMNKQNGGETCKFINSDFRAFCLKKYTINREDMLVKLKYNYSSKFWLF